MTKKPKLLKSNDPLWKDPIVQAIAQARAELFVSTATRGSLQRFIGESDDEFRIRMKRGGLAQTDEERALFKLLFQD